MSVTVQEALRLAMPPGTAVSGGRAGLENEVQWVSVQRSAPPAFTSLQAGDMALLSLDTLSRLDERLRLSDVIVDLAGMGVAALAVIGSVSPQARAIADAQGIPLLALPGEADLRQVERAVIRLIVDREAQLEHRASQIADQLNQLSLANQGLPAIIEAVANLTGKTVILQHGRDRRGQAGPPLPASVSIDQVMSPKEEPAGNSAARLITLDASGWAGLVRAIPVEDDEPAYLSVFGPADALDALDRLAVERGAMACALEFSKRRAIAVAEDKARGEFLDDLLAGRFDDEDEIRRRVEQLGYELAVPQAVISFAPGAEGMSSLSADRASRRIAGELERRRLSPSLVSEGDEGVVALCHTPEDRSIARTKQLLERLVEEWGGEELPPVAIGVGRRVDRLTELPRSYREAEQALSMGRRLGHEGAVVYFGDLGVYRLLFALSESGELEAFYEETLAPLTAYDEERNSELVKTLAALFTHHGNLSQTAETLHVHRNTLIYRLERIEEITDLDLDDPEARLSLQLALKIQQVLDASPG